MGRYRVWGTTHCITLAPELRQRLSLVHGDWLMMILDGDVIHVRKVQRREVFEGKTADVRMGQTDAVSEPRG